VLAAVVAALAAWVHYRPDPANKSDTYALSQLKAADVKRIPVELADAREKLWTPEKEKEGTKMNIWTPGSEETR